MGCAGTHTCSLFSGHIVLALRTLDSFGTEKLITFHCELILKGRLSRQHPLHMVCI